LKKISTDDIEDGMNLARPVTGPSGNVVLMEGATLSKALARRLKTWNIQSVFIESDETAQMDDGAKLKIAEQLNSKFGALKDDPIMGIVYDSLLEFRCTVEDGS